MTVEELDALLAKRKEDRRKEGTCAALAMGWLAHRSFRGKLSACWDNNRSELK